MPSRFVSMDAGGHFPEGDVFPVFPPFGDMAARRVFFLRRATIIFMETHPMILGTYWLVLVLVLDKFCSD